MCVTQYVSFCPSLHFGDFTADVCHSILMKIIPTCSQRDTVMCELLTRVLASFGFLDPLPILPYVHKQSWIFCASYTLSMVASIPTAVESNFMSN